ncbi:MAG: hypothetical protein ABSC54_10020 [Smithellaceae bacterium]|jgi:hypothetical protein
MENKLTNWQHFLGELKRLKCDAQPPKIILVDKREDSDFLERHPETAGYYDYHSDHIIILKEFDCLPLRLHEYGHWFNRLIFSILETFWEFPWWGLGLRSVFIKGKTNARPDLS